MDFALNLLRSREISAAENYGFHFETEEGLHYITKAPCWRASDILDLGTKPSTGDGAAQD